MIDHPHEGLERRGIRVDERHAPEVEVHRAGDVAVREIFGRTQIDDDRLSLALERGGQVARLREQLRIRISLHAIDRIRFDSRFLTSKNEPKAYIT